MGPDAPPSSTPNWTINVSDIRTVKVGNVSIVATERDMKDFFSFSGDIHYVEMKRETETSQVAYVTFKDSQGADTAMLLTGSIIADRSISITACENYQLPADAPPTTPVTKTTATGSAVEKTEDVVSTMLAKGFILGKDTLNQAKSFDERHHLTSNASATVASIDRTIGLSEKLSIGTAVVNEKVKGMDERFQVSEITKSAFAAAEHKASNAGAAIMSNPIVSTGASWLSSAFGAVSKAAEDVSSMTKEKVQKAEDEKKEVLYKEITEAVNDCGQVHLDGSSMGEIQIVTASSADNSKFAIV